MDFDLFKPKAPPLFGLDISSSSVKMLEIVEAGRGAYRVERYAIEPLIRDTVVDGNISNLEQAADAVKRAHKRLGTRTRHVAMAVPTGAVITKKIVVAAGLREDELEIQVESEANQYIPFALEEVNLDFQSLGPTANNPEEQEVLIAATRKEKVEDRVAVAHLAGLKPLVMDVESFAQQAALSLVVQALPGGGKDQNIAVVDVGANVMNVTVLRNDQSVYTREQAFGGNQLTQEIVSRYGMSAEEAETAKRSGGLPDDFEAEVLRPFMENLSQEVQRALHFLRQVLHERPQHLGLEIIRQAARALRRLRLLGAHAVAADDLLRQLVAAEGLLTRIDRLIVAQHRHVHHVGADVDDGDVLVPAAAGQRLHHQRQGRLLREGLDVHHQRLETGEVRDRDTVLDLLLARGGDQHLLLLGVVRRRPERLEIQIHFLERERNVLVRLAFDLDFELVLAQPRRDHDLLGDHGAGRHRHRDVPGARAKALVRALHRIGRLLEIADVAVDHRIANERLDGIALDPVRTSARFNDLEHLYRRRADVQPEQRRRLRLEQVEIHTLFSFTYQPLGAIRRIRVKC